MLSTVHTAVLSSPAALVMAFKKQLLAAKASQEEYAETLNDEEKSPQSRNSTKTIGCHERS
jgi:hypothetical protein